MAFERKWDVVPPVLFTANGGQFGLVTVADTAGFRVKQSAYILANGLPALPCQVKVVLSPTALVVGYVDDQIANWKKLNISAYTVAADAAIGAQEQNKNNITIQDIEKATYEADPVVAIRTINVDQYGDFYTDANPLPVSFEGSVSIGAVEVKGTNGNFIEPNSDGSINVIVESSSATSTPVNTYNQIVAVPSGATTQLVSYTVPVGNTAVLQRSVVSGENIARYDLLINGTIQDTVRTMFGANLTERFDFTGSGPGGLELNAGDIVTVQVLHNRPTAGDFNARIQVLLIS